jgi:Glycosyltransferase 61
MSDVLTVADVPVMPLQGFAGHDPIGGPIWPEFAAQTTARFCREAGVPVDSAPVPEECQSEIAESAVWGGYVHPHFGHLIAEHLTRVLPSLQARPDDLVLFTVEKDRDPTALPAFFHEVLDWYGVPRDRVRIIARPTLVRRLTVVPQGEMLWGKAPDASYLDLVDALPGRNGLTPVPDDLVYVARTGLVARGQGSHLGEGYLVQLLQALGVTILDPAKLGLREQLARYAGAKRLIFAEGSAVHGRQLLGRVRQDVHVLMRRVRYLARPLLRPRVRKLAYVNAHGGALRVRDRQDRGFPHMNAVFYNAAALLDGFDRIGIDLRAGWNQDAYLSHALKDAAQWEAAERDNKVLSGQNARVYQAEMSAVQSSFTDLPASLSADRAGGLQH